MFTNLPSIFILNLLARLVWDCKIWTIKTEFVSGKQKKKSKEKQKRQLWNIEVKVKSEISNLLP